MMEIMLDSVTEFHTGAAKFKLPNKFERYIEFDNTVVFLLDTNSDSNQFSKREKIIGVKLSQEGFYIAWEFQIIDGLNQINYIDGMSRGYFNNEKVIKCNSGSFLIQFSLDPETGEVLSKTPFK